MKFSKQKPAAAPAPAIRLETEDALPVRHKPTLFERLKIAIVMLLCVAGVGLISQFVLMPNSIRLDEAQSLWQTSHSLRGTLKVVAQDVHVPLYHVILHFWQATFGQSIETARLLSLAFFIATIPVVYLLARRVLSINWSLFVVTLFSFAPFMNWYANEARMYTLLVLVATLSQYFFVKLVESKGTKGWLGYTLTAMVGAYSHYFFLFNLLAQGLYYLVNRKHFVKRTFLKFTALAALLLVELSPWIYYFRSLGSASNTSPNLQVPSSVDLFNVYSQFAFGFQNDVVNTILLSLWPILVLVALLSVRQGQKVTKTIGYLLTAALVPILIAFIVSHLLTPFFVSRYMIASLAPLLIVTVWLVSHYRHSLALAVAALMVATVVGTSLQQYMSNTTPVKEDFKAAANLISQRAKPQDLVVLSAPFTVYPFNYYYDGDARVSTLPVWDRTVIGAIPAFEKGKLDAQVKQLNRDHQYIYLLLSSDQGYQEDIYQHYERRFEKTFTRQFSPDLELHVYRVGYSQLKPINDL